MWKIRFSHSIPNTRFRTSPRKNPAFFTLEKRRLSRKKWNPRKNSEAEKQRITKGSSQRIFPSHSFYSSPREEIGLQGPISHGSLWWKILTKKRSEECLLKCERTQQVGELFPRDTGKKTSIPNLRTCQHKSQRSLDSCPLTFDY